MGILRIVIGKFKNNAYLFLIPAGIFILIFYIVPNIFNFYYSFTDWNSLSDKINFVGFYNFIKLFKEKIIFQDIFITFKYAVYVAIVMNVVSLILAFALEKTTRLNGFFRAVFFLPVLISTIAAVYLFKAIYDTDGPINQFLGLLSDGKFNISFLGSITWTLFFVALIHSWRYFGIPMVVYIAGLNAIPEDLIEAAKVEGASYLQIVTKIKFPLLGPAFTFNIAVTLIGALSAFEIVLPLKGGPARSTEVLNYFIYWNFAYGHYGYTIAISAALFIIIAIVAVPLVLFLRSREVEL